MSHKFENLEAWKHAKRLAINVYQVSDKYPDKERFALTSQTTRSAVSIVANIAEGTSRISNKDFSHFLDIAIGSAFELETLLMLANERDYLDSRKYDELKSNLTDVIKLIYGLKRSLDE